ncbi:uncharacterized protein [Typha angustifolia]|uniref:uncharacterized protein n=1 Tax=Typha angustifolia TaxID=59011 RepID=UPI003C2FE018
MASDEENPVSGSQRYSVSGLFSCFGGSHVSDSGEAGRNGRPLRRGSAWLSWSRFRRKKRTVPVEISGDATMPCVEKHGGDKLENKKKRSKKRNSLFEKFRKEKSKGGGCSTKPHHNQLQKQHHPRPPPPPPPSHATASKCTAGNKPAPLYKMLDPARAGIRTRTSHPGSPKTAPHNSRESNGRSKDHLNPFMGLFVLTLALAVMLLAGKSCAILFMCAWFYLSPLLMPETDARNDKVKKVDGVIERDVDSDEYKKMVVLKGFLERDKRRTLHAS